MPRQDFLFFDEVCFDTKLQGSTLSATCVTRNFVPEPAAIDLNRCIKNDNGELKFDTRYGY